MVKWRVWYTIHDLSFNTARHVQLKPFSELLIFVLLPDRPIPYRVIHIFHLTCLIDQEKQVISSTSFYLSIMWMHCKGLKILPPSQY